MEGTSESPDDYEVHFSHKENLICEANLVTLHIVTLTPLKAIFLKGRRAKEQTER